MRVRLTPQEMYHFGLVGYRRNLESITKCRTPRFPEKYPGEMFARHIIAAMAEGSVAKALGVYFGFHAQKFSGGDVGDIEVRWSMRKDIKVRPRDSGVIVGVTGYPPDFEIVGFVFAEEVKRAEWSRDFGRGKPAFFVPHEQARDVRELSNMSPIGG